MEAITQYYSNTNHILTIQLQEMMQLHYWPQTDIYGSYYAMRANYGCHGNLMIMVNGLRNFQWRLCASNTAAASHFVTARAGNTSSTDHLANMLSFFIMPFSNFLSLSSFLLPPFQQALLCLLSSPSYSSFLSSSLPPSLSLSLSLSNSHNRW